MAELELLAEPRTVTGKQVQQLRSGGWVPAVLYGRDIESLSLQIDARSLERMLMEAGMTNLIALQIGQGGDKRTALVRDVQFHPIQQTIQHVDFYQVVMTEVITTEVNLVLVGEAPIVEQGFATVYQDLASVEIECLPGDLISHIDIDLSRFTAVDDTITVADLRVPAAVRILVDPGELVAHAEVIREEAEEVEEAVYGAEVELVRRPRAEEED